MSKVSSCWKAPRKLRSTSCRPGPWCLRSKVQLVLSSQSWLALALYGRESAMKRWWGRTAAKQTSARPFRKRSFPVLLDGPKFSNRALLPMLIRDRTRLLL